MGNAFQGDPKVAVAADGHALIVWGRASGPSGSEIRARRRSAAGVYGPILTLSAGEAAGDHQVAMNADGDALVAWHSFVGDEREEVQARAVSALGPIVFLVASDFLEGPQVVIDAEGDAFVIWERGNGRKTNVQGRALSADGVADRSRTYPHALRFVSPARRDASERRFDDRLERGRSRRPRSFPVRRRAARADRGRVERGRRLPVPRRDERERYRWSPGPAGPPTSPFA